MRTEIYKDSILIEVLETPDAPFTVMSCSPWQMRKALNQLNLRATVESAVSTSDQTTKDGWEFATEFRSDDPLVVNLAEALSIDIPTFFKLACSL